MMKMGKRSFANYLASSVCTSALFLAPAAYAATEKSVTFNITASDLSDALNQLAQQSDRQIVYASDVAAGRQAKPLQGAYSTQAALDTLLRGSGLVYRMSKDDTIIVVADKPRAAGASSPNPIRLAAAETRVAATASTTNSAAAPVEEVVVTGSRIVREGYEAPTPLTVVGAEQLQTNANAGLIDYLNNMPALSGSALSSNNTTSVTGGFPGGASVNLKSLGASRTLVLLNGQRLVGAEYHNIPNVAAIPQQLIERVDIVTGGASAVYGSQAVAGVVNFVLNTKFIGVKGEVSGGLTNYGDDKNYKIDLTAGVGFMDDRGHLLLSVEHNHNQGIRNNGGREWDTQPGYFQFVNPAYNATTNTSVPQQLFLPHVGMSGALPGGIITAGPLKGTAFGAGGVPFKYNYGPIVSFPYSTEGDWALNNRHAFQDLDPDQTIHNVFTQLSYDFTDNITAHIQYMWNQFSSWHNDSHYNDPAGATSPLIKLDNAYLPASVRAAMVANGVTQFQLGTDLADLGYFGANPVFIGNRINGGLDGKFDAFGTTWHWQADYLYASTKSSNHTFPGVVRSKLNQSADAVVNPATGQIVCRITLTDPTNPCKPWNVMGIGVNTGNVVSFTAPNFLKQLIELESYNASITGEPFSLWAGPVSIALSFEHRWESDRSVIDAESIASDRLQGVNQSVNGAQNVTEGAAETLIPLAKNESWAQNWDLSLAIRYTSYQLSGDVTTWKIGTTYAPIDDIKFRFTRSRDIRAPNFFELFVTPGAVTGGTIIDHENNNQVYPFRTGTVGNPALQPEKADTTGIGLVLSPHFLEGFTASIDYWDVNLNGAIKSLAAQQIEDACFATKAANVCAAISRDPTSHLITAVNSQSINLAVQDLRGLDIEASYRTPMSAFVDSWAGNLSLHSLVTFYLRNFQSDPVSGDSNHLGEAVGGNGGDGANPPFWKVNVTATYSVDPVSVSLTGRAISQTHLNAMYIECTTGCPASTAAHNTINNNKVPGRFYLDANVNYKLNVSDAADTELFLSAKNLFNNDPPPLPGSIFSNQSGSGFFDSLGTVYRAGIRFKM